MFIIPCKATKTARFIYDLVKSIRQFHDEEKIVIIDSDSSDKSYFELANQYKNVAIEDIANKNWMVGAYWTGYKKYKDEDDFFYFMHDSCLVKGNLSYMRRNPITIMMWFYRHANESFDKFGPKINAETSYKYINNGLGCFGPMMFCQKIILESMIAKGADKILPSNKAETGWCEGCFGFFIEQEGFNPSQISLYGDMLGGEVQSKIGGAPHTTDWMYPIQKRFGAYSDPERL